MLRRTLFVALTLGLFVVASASAQTTIYVDIDASGSETGSSWNDAYTSLQDALDEAAQNDGTFEIWVAEGTYLPTRLSDVSDPRTATFYLLDDVALYGGFDGSESSRTDRNPDPETNGTVLSGDIGSSGFQGDNAYHVVTGSNTSSTAILDGFTITGGYANTSDHNSGGGMINEEGSPTIRNCLFEANSADDGGGGISNYRSSPTITGCTFQNNDAQFAGGAIENSFESSPTIRNATFSENTTDLVGGAVRNSFGSSPRIIDSEFVGNVADFEGGAIDNTFNSNPTFINVRFAGNVADDFGGAIYNDESSPYVVNTLFTGNRARDGGAVYNENSAPTLVNVTISGNLAEGNFTGGDGGGIYNDEDSTPQMRNTILWNNKATENGHQIFIAGPAQPSFSHSIVEGGMPGEAEDDGNNIDEDPEFEASINPDDAPTVEGDFRILTDGASVLDRGNNSYLPPDSLDIDGDDDTSEQLPYDYEGTERIIDNNTDGSPVVDIGAYEAPSSVIPVELVSFEGRATEGGAELTWRTASETNNAGFEVQRRVFNPKEDSTKWKEVHFVQGMGTTSQAQSYRFEDTSIPYGASKVKYRLKQVDTDGAFEHSPTVEVVMDTPAGVVLHDNFPNPFQDETTIRYELSRAQTRIAQRIQRPWPKGKDADRPERVSGKEGDLPRCHRPCKRDLFHPPPYASTKSNKENQRHPLTLLAPPLPSIRILSVFCMRFERRNGIFPGPPARRERRSE